jgi:capsular polysaccharide biosynthesis protein
MLWSFAGHKERAVVLPVTDDPRRFNGRALRRFAAATRGRAGVASTTTTQGVVVIDRQWVDPRSTQDGVERSGYGPTRRSIPNMTDVVDRLARNGPVDLLEAGLLSPVEQVNRFAAASVLVGQHGAGLANMLWMPTGSTVIEIITQKKRKHQWFEALARALGHAYVAVIHSGPHDPVDPDEIAAVVDLAVAGGGSNGRPAP